MGFVRRRVERSGRLEARSGGNEGDLMWRLMGSAGCVGSFCSWGMREEGWYGDTGMSCGSDGSIQITNETRRILQSIEISLETSLMYDTNPSPAHKHFMKTCKEKSYIRTRI